MLHGTRREIIAALLGLPLGLSCKRRPSAFDYDGAFVEDHAAHAHRLRTEAPPQPATLEEVPTLIVGGGIAGLTAAWTLAKADAPFLLLDLADQPGGTSSSGSSSVTRYPWGAHYLPAPTADNPDLLALLVECGAKKADGFAETALVGSPKERVHYRGEWHRGLFPPSADADVAQYRRFSKLVEQYVKMRGKDGRRAFALPIAQASEDPRILALDQISMATLLDRERFDSPLLRWYVDYACRDDFGLELSQTSAWYGLHYFAARVPGPGEESAPFLTWPEGNDYLVRHLCSRFTKRIRSQVLITGVEPHPNGRARVVGWDRGKQRAIGFIAEKVILAVPTFVRNRILRGFDVPRVDLSYAPWMVANVHLADRPRYYGFETAWDNVIQSSRSLGYVVATHQGGSSYGPTVWTWYLPYPDEDDRAARRRLSSLPWRDAADVVFAELDRTHVDFGKHVRRIDLRRWGHGMVQPRPGTRSRLPSTTPIGPIHLAHTDLSGVALFEEAFFHGRRAAREVLGTPG